MAVDLDDRESRQLIGRAVRRSFDLAAQERARRADLIGIYKDRSRLADQYLTDNGKLAYLNMFALFVRGQEITLAYRAPRYAVNARTQETAGFDKRIQNFLNAYTCILDFKSLVHQWAVDSAFGRCAAKVVSSIAPKGIVSPVAPRAYRLNPDHVIVDRSANSLQQMMYVGDLYFVDLDEAKKHTHFDKEQRERLTKWAAGGHGSNAFPHPEGDHELFASDQTRLIDIYFPTLGVLATWAAPSDNFDYIANNKPLMTQKVPCNPYVLLDMLFVPDSLEILSRLGQLRPLNMLANDLFNMSANQAKQSKRNPVAKLGEEQEMNALLSQPDGEAAFLTDPKALDIFTLPGPDPSVLNLANLTQSLFSSHAGNLTTALGIDPGAGTAKQTQALIGQISQSQAIDRAKFESFLAEIGKRLATIAFHDGEFQFDFAYQIPGTTISINQGWSPDLERIGYIDDYNFEVVPFSTSFRSPQDRLMQLDAASKLVLQYMQAAALGAPIDLAAVLEDAQEAFDLVPNLQRWWNGQSPQPQESTPSNVYQSTASPGQGSEVRYIGNSGPQGQASLPQDIGGLASATQG